MRFTELLTKSFQKELRDSKLWDHLAAEFGEEKAKRVLKQCKAYVTKSRKPR